MYNFLLKIADFLSKKVKNMSEHKSKCDHPDIKAEHKEGCTLNQMIKCHGNEPFKDLLKRTLIDEDK